VIQGKEEARAFQNYLSKTPFLERERIMGRCHSPKQNLETWKVVTLVSFSEHPKHPQSLSLFLSRRTPPAFVFLVFIRNNNNH